MSVAFVVLLILAKALQGFHYKKANNSAHVDDTDWYKSNLAGAEKSCNPDDAIASLDKMWKEAIAQKNDWKCCVVLLSKGEKLMRKGMLAQALDYMNRALPYASNLPLHEIANVYQHIGWVYFELGDYVTATDNYYKALAYLKECPFEMPNFITVSDDLGSVYFRLHQNDKALYYFNLSEFYTKKLHWNKSLIYTLSNKGEYFFSIHQIDSARKYFIKVQEAGVATGRPEAKAISLLGLGRTYLETGDYIDAYKYLQQAVNLSVGRNNQVWTASSFYLGEALFHLKKYTAAEAVLTLALRKSYQSQLKDERMKGYATLVSVYKATGQYLKALSCMDSLIALKESLVNVENAKAINLMDIKFQTAEKDKEIAEQNSKIARKNMWIVATGCGLTFMLILLTSVYLHARNKQRHISKENKIQLLNAAIEGGENERRRIARELHDGIGGMLSAAMMRFSSMKHIYPQLASVAYNDGMTMLREMGDEIRKTAHNLMPGALREQGLVEAIKTFCSKAQQDRNVRINFQCYGCFTELSEDFELNVYRIVQELIKNAISHASASTIAVQLLHNENKLVVAVEDTGVGFDKNIVKKGLGLNNIQTRANKFGGHFTIDSSYGKGTVAIVEFEMGNNRKKNFGSSRRMVQVL